MNDEALLHERRDARAYHAPDVDNRETANHVGVEAADEVMQLTEGLLDAQECRVVACVVIYLHKSAHARLYRMRWLTSLSSMFVPSCTLARMARAQ